MQSLERNRHQHQGHLDQEKSRCEQYKLRLSQQACADDRGNRQISCGIFDHEAEPVPGGQTKPPPNDHPGHNVSRRIQYKGKRGGNDRQDD